MRSIYTLWDSCNFSPCMSCYAAEESHNDIFRGSNVYIFIPTQLKCCKKATMSSIIGIGAFKNVEPVLQMKLVQSIYFAFYRTE